MRHLDVPQLYGTIMGSIIIILCLIRAFSSTARWRVWGLLIKRKLTLNFLLRRHRFVGPWTWGSVFVHLYYIAANLALILFGDMSLTTAHRRAGSIAVVNMSFLFSFAHLSFMADALGTALETCQRIHRAVGWMTLALQFFHICVAALNTRFDVSTQRSTDFAGILGAASVGALVILSLALVRRWSYEIFLRTHQILAAVNVYGIFRHLPHDNHFAKVCVYIALGALALTSSVQLMVFLYRNGLFASRGCPRAIVHSYGGKVEDDSKEIKDGVVKMCITLPRPIRVEPGQYINLWMPTVSLWSWAQTHPFTIVSWSPDPQGTLDLLVQPSRGFSADIFRHLKPFEKQETSVLFMSFLTGPHGISKKVNGYESVVVVASGFGIAAVVPYIRHMIHGYNTCTSQVRRIHLVWQVESPMGIAVVSENLLNTLLDDDIIDKGYILNISIYQRNGQLLEAKLPVGDKSKVFMYQGSPDYQQMISLETSGDLVERHLDIPDKCGDALVMVSTTDDVRDQLRDIIRERNDTRINLMELEYQPSKA